RNFLCAVSKESISLAGLVYVIETMNMVPPLSNPAFQQNQTVLRDAACARRSQPPGGRSIRTAS
ncbi:hypothetical protein ABTH54_19615, partial [Acinetobacter baumannii]